MSKYAELTEIEPSELVVLGVAQGDVSGYKLHPHEAPMGTLKQKFVVSYLLDVRVAILTVYAPISYVNDLEGDDVYLVLVPADALPVIEPVNTISEYKTIDELVGGIDVEVQATVLTALRVHVAEDVYVGGKVYPFRISGECVVRTRALARRENIKIDFMRQFYWIPDFVKPAPQMGEYTAIGSAGHSLAINEDGSVYHYNVGSTGDSVRAYVKPKSGQLVYEIAFVHDLYATNYQAVGIILKNSAANQFVLFSLVPSVGYGLARLEYTTWHNFTAIAAPASIFSAVESRYPFWLRLVVTATNRELWWSSNGRNFIKTPWNIANNHWVAAPNQVGFFIDSTYATPSGNLIVHIKEE